MLKDYKNHTQGGVHPLVFSIGADGKIIQVWYKVSPEDTVPKAREALQAQK